MHLGPPGPPSKPEIENINGHTVTLSWRRPAEDGGSDIIGYSVEKKEKKAVRWMRASKKSIAELTFEVTGLTEGVEYEFRVLAENRAGFGEPSETSMPVRTTVAACKFKQFEYLRLKSLEVIKVCYHFEIEMILCCIHIYLLTLFAYIYVQPAQKNN